jgi:hypothetical protein
VRTFIGRSRPRCRRGRIHIAGFLVAIAHLSAAASTVPTPSTQTASTRTTSSGTSATRRPSGSSALKQIDRAALQTMMDRPPRNS